MERERIEELARTIVDACITVHKEMGPGLLESIYELCLIRELREKGLSVGSQVSIPLLYKGTDLSKDFRIDILVEHTIILEIKSVDALLPVHEAQLLSYLKLADKRLGFLLNFNVRLMKEGIRRFVNRL